MQWDRAGPRRGLAVLVAGTFFMEILDGTILSTAAPGIAHSLGVRPADIGVAITSYLVTLAVLIPLSGWLADRFGTRTVFLTAIALFTVASALCALSTSLPELAALRVLQGAGGALMVPVGRLVVLRNIAKSDLISAIALLTWPALVAPIAAPLAGGLLTTYLSWRWIFLINVPLGVVALVCAARMVPQLRTDDPRPLDRWGLLLTAGGLGALVFALSALGAEQVQWIAVAATAIAAAGLGGLGVRHLLRHPHPLLDLTVFRIRTFALSHAGGSIFRATVYAVPFLLPLMFQEGFGWSPVRAGAMVMAVFAGNLAIKPFTTGFLRRRRFRTVISVSALVVAVTMLACAALTPQTPVAVLIVLLVVSGAARSTGFTAYGTLAFADVEDRQMSGANALSSTIQQLAGGLGVAVAALALQLATSFGSGASATGPYRVTFVLLALLTLVAAGEALTLDADAGHRLHA